MIFARSEQYRIARPSLLWTGLLASCLLCVPGSPAMATVTATIDAGGLLAISSDADDVIRIGCSAGAVLVSGVQIGDPPVQCTEVIGLEISAGSGNDRIYLNRWNGDDALFPNLETPVVISDAGGIDTIDCSECPVGVTLSYDIANIVVYPFRVDGAFIFDGQIEHAVGTPFDDQIIINLSQTERVVDGGAHAAGDELIVNGDCGGYEQTDTELTFTGYASISYSDFEAFILTCLAIEDKTWGNIKALYR
jgi:hypothetical protein